MKLEVGDIIFYKSQSLIGKLISKLTHSPYSHVALYVGDNNILEADRFIKSRITPLVIEDRTLIKVMRYQGGLTEGQKNNLIADLQNVVGRRYDYVAILFLFLKLVFNVDTNSILDDLNKFICSELIDYEYLRIGVDIVPNVDNHIVTPSDLESSPVLKEITIT